MFDALDAKSLGGASARAPLDDAADACAARAREVDASR